MNMIPLAQNPFGLLDYLVIAGIPQETAERFTEEAADNLEAYLSAGADNTIIAFRKDMRRWFIWSRAADVDPFAPKPRDVRDYIRAFAPDWKPGTVQRMIGNLSVLLQRIIMVQNVTRSEIVRGELKRLKREKGTRHKQALPIRAMGDVSAFGEPALPFSVDRMIYALGDDQSAWSCRARLLLSLCSDTGRRNSEYRAANMRDLTRSGDGTGLFEIPHSKTDQEGRGMVRFACRRTMRLYDEWRTALAAISGDVGPEAPLLVSFNLHGQVRGRLSIQGFTEVLRAIVLFALTKLAEDHPELLADIERIVAEVSGHSFRVGFVQDLVTAGESLVAICVEGGWSDPSMPGRYARNINARTGAAARLRRTLGDGEVE